MVSYKSVPQRPIFSLLVLALFVIVDLSFGAVSRAQTLTLEPDRVIDDVLATMRVVDAPSLNIHDSDARKAALMRARSEPASGIDHKLGTVWFFAKLENSSNTIGTWKLATEMLAPGRFTAFIRHGDDVKQIMHANYPVVGNTPEVSQGPPISSDVIQLSSGEQLELWVFVENGSFLESYPVRLMPDAMHRAIAESDLRWQSFYTGMAGLLIAYFLIFSRLLGSKASACYAGFFAALVFLNLHSYGAFERYSDIFRAQHFAVYLPMHMAVIGFYTLFAVNFLSLRDRSPQTYRFIVWSVGGILGVHALNIFFSTPFFDVLMKLGYPAIFAITTWTALVAAKEKIPGAVIFIAGSAVFALSSSAVAIAPSFGNLAVNGWLDRLTLSGQLLYALIFAAGIVRQTFVLRQERDQSLQSELAMAREKLSLRQALMTTKNDLETAQAISTARHERLLSTQHDLRQPLKTFQLAIDNTTESDPDTLAKLHAGLDYMHRVLDPSKDALDLKPSVARSFKTDGATETEIVPIQVIFDNLHRLYADEAASKDLALVFAPTSLDVQTDSIALIRILSNLVSNAIKYTATGRVLVGARRKAFGVTIEVWDTGPGVHADDQQRIFRRFKRGQAADTTEGQGLGLSIARNLAEELSVVLTLNSWPGKGSVFSVTGLRRTPNI